MQNITELKSVKELKLKKQINIINISEFKSDKSIKQKEEEK